MRPLLTFLLLLAVMLPLAAETELRFKHRGSSDYAEFYSTESAFQSSNLAGQLDERIFALQADLGIYTSRKVEIFVLNSAAEYQALSRGKDKIVEFSDAFYSSREERIYIRSKQEIQESYLQILQHEYTHWYLDQIFDSAPLWFHEGMATYYAGQLGYERYLHFLQSSFWGNPGELLLSSSYPKEQKDWQSFYLSSYFAVKWMKEKNQSSWQNFWDRTAQNWRRGYQTDFRPSFRLAYGMELWQFHAVFGKYIKRLSFQYLIVAINAIILALMPIVLILAARRRKKKRALLPDLPLPVEPDLPEEQGEDDTPES